MQPSRNVALNLLEVLFSAIILFYSYRFSIRILGLESLGIWALASAITALSRAADLGVSAGTTRLVALHRENYKSVLRISRISLLINAGLYSVIAAGIAVATPLIASHVTTGSNILLLERLMPAVLLSFWLTNISSAASATLIGYGRSDLKSISTIVGYIVQLVSTIVLVPRYGLIGLAMAQAAQCSTTLSISIWFIQARDRTNSTIGLRDSVLDTPLLIRQIFSVGLKAQALTIAGFLFEPLTKFALSSTCGLQTVALYELASRGILQARQLIVTPTSNLTPIFARDYATSNARATRTYYRAAATMAILAPAYAVLLILASPVVSLVLLKAINTQFVIGFSGLSILWTVNIIALPAYFLGLGANKLRWSVLGAFTTAATSPILISLLANSFGNTAGILAPGFAVAIGGLITMMNARFVTARICPPPAFPARILRLQYRALQARWNGEYSSRAQT